MPDTTAYTIFNKNSTTLLTHGGGVAIGVHRHFNARNREELIPDEFKWLELLLVQTVSPIINIFIANFYIPEQDKKKFCFLKTLIGNWLLSLIQTVPDAVFVINGDFNPKSNISNCRATMCLNTLSSENAKRIEEKLPV